jgi:hypothetical protein
MRARPWRSFGAKASNPERAYSSHHQPGARLGILEQFLQLIGGGLDAAAITTKLGMRPAQLEAVIAAALVASPQSETMIETASEALGISARRCQEAVDALGGVQAIVRLSRRLNYPDHGLPAK